jgi:acyl-CoA synthetase (AMP-forming)/AMP-acid ligase II
MEAIHTRMTMAEALHYVAGQHPDREALICDDVRLTYGQLRDSADALARGLAHLRVRPGDRVATCLPPDPAFVQLFFALAQLGGVIVPMDPQLRRRLLRYILQEAEPVALLASGRPEMASQWELLREVAAEVPGLRHLLVTGPGVSRAGQPGPAISLADVVAAGETASPLTGISDLAAPQASPEDLLALLFTSGTTGLPKGTMHSHRTLIAPVVASLRLRRAWLKYPSLETVGRMARLLARYRERLLQAAGRPQTFLATTGLHNITGLEVMLQALLMGDCLILMPHFDPVKALRLVEQERVTVLVGVPMTLDLILRLKELEHYDLSSLLICGTGGAPCPPQLARQIQQRLGCAVHIGFGATELAGGIAATSLEDSEELQAETVGRPMTGIEIKIVDEERRLLPVGQVGELACRGENLMLGYYQAPDLTAQAVDSAGWYYTGDLAVMDERGYVRIVGRKKDMIIRGGQNIYPQEIKQFLAAHPRIREAAVVGVPQAIGGERVWAFIIPETSVEGATEAPLTAREVLNYCRRELEAYKLPDQVRFVADFPRAASGKPQKFRLRELALQVEDPRQGEEGHHERND